MNDKGSGVYSEYFTYRNVGSDYYNDFVFPEYLKKALPIDYDAAILDIGCGFGQMLKALHSEGYCNLKGVDISMNAVSFCESNGLDVTKIDSIAYYCSNAGKRFDFIIMSHVLEHIDKPEIIETLRAIRENLLNAGGMMIVMVPNAQSNTGCYWAYEDFTHHTIFTSGSLFFVLKSAGFEIVEFLDPDGLEGSKGITKCLKKILLYVYRGKKQFWNKVTSSSYHNPSQQIFTYELKALAR